MGVLSRSVLVVFILYAVGFWAQVGLEKSAEAWTMAAVMIGSAVLFMILGRYEDNP